jgi:hypothetical protein
VDFSGSYFRMQSPIVQYECHMPPLCVASARGDLDAVRTLLDQDSWFGWLSGYDPLCAPFL